MHFYNFQSVYIEVSRNKQPFAVKSFIKIKIEASVFVICLSYCLVSPSTYGLASIQAMARPTELISDIFPNRAKPVRLFKRTGRHKISPILHFSINPRSEYHFSLALISHKRVNIHQYSLFSIRAGNRIF